MWLIRGARDPPGSVLPHTLCVAAGRAHSVHTAGLRGGLSCQAAQASGLTILLPATGLALRGHLHGIRSASFRTGVKDVGSVPCSMHVGGGISGVASPVGRHRCPWERQQPVEERTGWARALWHGDLRRSLSPVSFTEHGTDPGSRDEGCPKLRVYIKISQMCFVTSSLSPPTIASE
jgi:hypothetical protein